MIEIDQGAKHPARPRALQNHEPALGPDGFIGSFYKECWDIIKLDIIAVIKEMFAL
jgi:hypothetical protein